MFMQNSFSSSRDTLTEGYAKAFLQLDSALFSLAAASCNWKHPLGIDFTTEASSCYPFRLYHTAY